MKLFVLILFCFFKFGKVTPMVPQTMGETSQKVMAIEENSQDSDSDYATANESDSSEQLADNSSSVEDQALNVIVPPTSSPKKQRVVTFNLVPSTESSSVEWDRLFIRQEMPKIKWLCPDNGENALCENARFANRILRKYLEYQNAAITINNVPTNDKYKKENHEKNIEKDNLLKCLALKPSFLSSALNNLSAVKITLLKTYKKFNLNESADIKQLETITGNFSNMENCGKVLKLAKAFKKGVNELESKKVKSDKIRNLVKKLKKYRRALESIKVEMELDSGYCKECKILTIDEILKTNSATKKVEQLISQTKILRKNFAKFVKHD